jgi:hypothetical protein
MSHSAPHGWVGANALSVLLLFFLLANISFKGIESFTTGRLAIAGLAPDRTRIDSMPLLA